MPNKLKLMAVLAHPDDESLGMGGTLARYNDEGVETILVCATRGERGRYGERPERPSIEELGKIREAELRAAGEKLGVSKLGLLDYVDGDLDKAAPNEAIRKIVTHIRDERPQVVLTFGPEGAYGHPDHIAISQFTSAAVVCAADTNYKTENEPHRIDKLYYMSWTKSTFEAFESAFREIKVNVDGVERRTTPAPDWLVTTQLDTAKYTEQVWAAVCCHKTQMAIYDKLDSLAPEHHRAIWGIQQFYRAFSTVNGGRERENDLFAGLR